MDRRLFSGLTVVGIGAFLLGFFLTIMTPWPATGFITLAVGLLLSVAGILGGLVTRPSKPTAKPPPPPPRPAGMARAGLGLLAASVLGFILLASLGPEVHEISGLGCEDAPQFRSLGARDWIAIRSPQRSHRPPVYDARNDTTLVVPGCDHKNYDFALRVRGNHPSLLGSYRMVLSAESSPAPTGFVPVNSTEQGEPTRATEAVLQERSIAPLVLANAGVMVCASAGVAALALQPWRRAAVAASGSIAGSLWAVFRLVSGYGLFDFLILWPAMLLALVIGIGMLIGTQRTSQRRAAAVWVISFALSAMIVFMLLVEAFPTQPEA